MSGTEHVSECEPFHWEARAHSRTHLCHKHVSQLLASVNGSVEQRGEHKFSNKS